MLYLSFWLNYFFLAVQKKGRLVIFQVDVMLKIKRDKFCLYLTS